MKRSKVLLLLILIVTQILAYAQKKQLTKEKVEKTHIPAPNSYEESNKINKNLVYKFLIKDEIPRSFSWEFNEDKLLPKNSVYEEIITFNCTKSSCENVGIKKRFVSENTEMFKKVPSDSNGNILVNVFENYSTNESYTFDATNDIIKLHHSNEKKTTSYKVYFDKPRTTIKSLENLETKKIYIPNYSFGGSPGM